MAAPIYADLKGLAPLLVQVGAAETLLDDGIRLAKGAGAADVHVDLQIWPEMVHVWHMFHPELMAGKRAIQAGADYIRAVMASWRELEWEANGPDIHRLNLKKRLADRCPLFVGRSTRSPAARSSGSRMVVK